jgi:hypothetical protein
MPPLQIITGALALGTWLDELQKQTATDHTEVARIDTDLESESGFHTCVGQ